MTKQAFCYTLATIRHAAIQSICGLALMLKTWLTKLQKIGKKSFLLTQAQGVN
jgi:hypothetical protein